MMQQMTVVLLSKNTEFLRPTKSVLEADGFVVIPAVRESQIAEHVSANAVNVMVVDVAFCGQQASRIVEQVNNEPRLADTGLILFSRSRAELRDARVDAEVVRRVDDVVVETFDGSDLIDRIKSVATRVKQATSKYGGESAEWNDPYGADEFKEQRNVRRFSVQVPVSVKGRDVFGEPFEEEALIVNISGGGAYMKSGRHLEVQSALDISVPASQTLDGSFEARGTIVRTEPGTDRDEPKRRRVAVRFGDEVGQKMDFQVWLAGLSDSS